MSSAPDPQSRRHFWRMQWRLRLNNPTEGGAVLVRAGQTWSALGSPASVTWGFRGSAASGQSESATFAQVNSAERSAIQLALQEWSDVARITFTGANTSGTSDVAAILFANYSSTAPTKSAGHAYLPATKDTSAASTDGDVWFNLTSSPYTNLALGSDDFSTVIHEIGHAIGLDHPGNYDAGDSKVATYAANAAFVQDSMQFTVMSYFEASNTGANHTYNGVTIQASTPLMYDIAAAQLIYGANTTTRTGDNVYGFNNTAGAQYNISGADNQVVFCIYDAGGVNTLDVSGYSNNQRINLNANTFSDVGALTSNVSIAAGTTIQKAVGGSGNDLFVCNNAGDTITGGRGADAITGGTGVDTAVFSGTLSQYAITRGATMTVADSVSGRDGTDSMTSVEQLKFTDFTLVYDLSSSQDLLVYKLYQAAYARTPDNPGFRFWATTADAQNTSALSLANSFLGAPEFSQKYGASPTNSAYVTALYTNVLGRTPDSAGLDFWIGQANNGAGRDSLLVSFALSGENATLIASHVANGYWTV